MDLIAHPFVLDAKSSRQKLADHEGQIRTYINQRHLDFGVLINLGEVRVYRRAANGHDESLSFSVERLWRLARDEAQTGPDLEAFGRFVSQFSYRAIGLPEKVDAIREARPWEEPEALDAHLKLNPGFEERLLAITQDISLAPTRNLCRARLAGIARAQISSSGCGANTHCG